MIRPSSLDECCGTTCDAQANKEYVRELEEKLARYEALLDDVYDHGRSNPSSAPNCVMAVVDAYNSEVEVE